MWTVPKQITWDSFTRNQQGLLGKGLSQPSLIYRANCFLVARRRQGKQVHVRVSC